jgi:hypothetical protein
MAHFEVLGFFNSFPYKKESHSQRTTTNPFRLGVNNELIYPLSRNVIPTDESKRTKQKVLLKQRSKTSVGHSKKILNQFRYILAMTTTYGIQANVSPHVKTGLV